MAHVPSGYAHGHNVQFSYLFSGFILRVFNSNVTTEFVQLHYFVSQNIGRQNILCPFLSKSQKWRGHVRTETRPLTFCIFFYVSHAVVSGAYPWVASISLS